jgi:Rieske Fe-S protein
MNLISRRSAVRGLGVVAVGGIVGYAVGRQSDAAKGQGTNGAANSYGAAATGGRRLAGLSQVPEGGGLILNGDKIVLTRDSDGTLHAFSSICTHQGCPVDRVANGTISCPCHGSKFDATTGAVTAGPAPSPLPTVAVTVRGSDIYAS